MIAQVGELISVVFDPDGNALFIHDGAQVTIRPGTTVTYWFYGSDPDPDCKTYGESIDELTGRPVKILRSERGRKESQITRDNPLFNDRVPYLLLIKSVPG